jgi:hypothetical protein
MTVDILKSARLDLIEGYYFYECQRTGLGEYLLASLSADIEALPEYAGIREVVFGYHQTLSEKLPYLISIACKTTASLSMRCWMAAEIPTGSPSVWLSDRRRVTARYCHTRLDLWLGSTLRLDELRIPAGIEAASGGEIEKFLSDRKSERK